MTLASVNWTAAEAIGTISAAVVALGIALAPAIVRMLRRPRLGSAVSDHEPHTLAIGSRTEINIAETVLLRVEVRNEGRSAARDCWAVSGRRWRADLPPDPDWKGPEFPGDFDPRWKLVDSEPMALRWSSVPPAETRERAGRVNIRQGRSEFAELAVLKPRTNLLEVAVDDKRACRTATTEHQAIARHRWEIVFGAADLEPVVRVIEFAVDGKNFITDVIESAAPVEADDIRLLHLLRSAAS